MPRKCREPYTCPCCNYSTKFKTNILHHFYNLKKPCPKTSSVIELTEDIKQYILINRIYLLPETETSITNIITNNNTINNFIANMDSIQKLTKFITYQDASLIEYPQTIENKFAKRIKKLTEGTSNFLILDKHNLLEVIDQVSTLSNETFENLNIVYDEKFNKLKLYDSGEWTDFILINGIRTLLMKIQEVYFDPYECYLIRKIEYSNFNLFNKQRIKEKLEDYYKFLGCFEIQPYVNGKNDTEIKYNSDDERFDPCLEFTDKNREIPIKYMNLYTKTRDETMISQLSKIKRDIIDIIKNNSKKNIDELNKKVFVLFNMDEEFKKIIINF